jgi:class 3 adenylate cyclase/tetratricopeptide (TPR) repeat protein
MEGTTMQCPKCQFENRKDAQFCSECGHKFELSCPECGNSIGASSKFCDGCGCKLESPIEALDNVSETESPPRQSTADIKTDDLSPINGERKHVTVLFSDLTGYTAMSEKLDPEEVKEITTRIFGEISKIVAKYDGFIEKYVGDAVMAIFGVPQTHEDDPIRAIKAAREIHHLVDAFSPKVENKIGKSISMHTGINTGLVVTGEVDIERGTHGIAGDTINLASRLSNLANPGEILVNVDTCRQIEGYFTCEYLKTATVKGKSERVEVHRVLSQREKPVTIRRLSGVRADLVGRKIELAELAKAVENLRVGKGSIFAIYGDAGTGKSRLVEEFRATLDFEEFQWQEGHAYAYAQNIPYFPMIDLLNRVFQIEEGDSSEKVRYKLQSGIKQLIGNNEEIYPYIGGLYSLSIQKLEEVSPEFWKTRLHESLQAILATLAKKTPTIFYLEDLHWADSSFVELFRKACLEMRQPAIVLCAYRPPFCLFTSHELSSLGNFYHEIRLEDLSLSDAQDMIESLLKTDSIPSELKRLVQSKAEGNPFYLEELVNSMIESETLIQDNGNWKITRPITESDISSSIHGLISDRLDRLKNNAKRILQEASVIGRAFFYEILKRITELQDCIDRGLSTLERIDLIRTRSFQPDLEYIFKHALTQEVVYSGLLKKERQEIHERIGLVIEKLFSNRLPEFYETLAHHFSNGKSVLKAADYLAKSGEKNFKRFSLDEAHQYFYQGYELIKKVKDKSDLEKELLIDILTRWALVFYYRGDFIGLENLLSSQEETANKIDDKEKAVMFFAWKGFVAWWTDKFDECNENLEKAIELSESSNSLKAKGYALTWLSWLYVEIGLFEKGIETGMEGNKIAKLLNDPYLYFKSLGAVSRSHFYTGNSKECLRIGKHLVDYGTQANHIRCIVMGHWNSGEGYFAAGDFASAKISYTKAHSIAKDPFFVAGSLGFSTLPDIAIGNMTKASEYIDQIVDYFTKYGNQHGSHPSQMVEGIVLIDAGHFSKGWKVLSKCRQYFKESGRINWHYNIEHIMGKIFLTIVQGEKSVGVLSMVKNAKFIISKAIFAYRLAEDHFKTAIEIADRAGATGFIGQVYLDLAILYKIKNRHELTVEYLEKAVPIFKEVGAYEHLKQANKILTSLV